MPNSHNRDVERVINLFGNAIRMDWSSIDGRSIRDSLEYLSGQIDTGVPDSFEEMLDRVGVTVDGEWVY